jgi:hypothetical protein
MMKSHEALRITLLCEDRMQEQFLTAICEEHGWQVIDRHVAPAGLGAGSQWVRKQFPERVLYHRRWRRENRALLVAIDGDNVGLAGRCEECNAELTKQGKPGRAEDEAIALLVPTWSIETWILFLYDRRVVPEQEKSKDLVPNRLKARKARGTLIPARGTLKSDTIRQVMQAWVQGAEHPELPSLTAGRIEVERLKNVELLTTRLHRPPK